MPESGDAGARHPPVTPDADAALLSPEYLVDPYPIYARLRREPPIAWSEALNGWIVTRYADVRSAMREPRLSAHGRMPAFLAQLPDEGRAAAAQFSDHYESTLPFMEGSRHKTLRTLLQDAFSAAAAEALRDDIEQLADSFLDAAEGDEFDLMAQYAKPFPVHVMGNMLGVPPPDRAQFIPWTDQIIAVFSTGRVTTDVMEAGRQALVEMRSYLSDLIAERRRQPKEDLISWLVANSSYRSAMKEANSEPVGVLTAEEVLANCVTLYTAGHASTSGLIGKAFLALFRHPGQLQRLRDHPDLIDNAVEEFLRYDTSVQRAWRVAPDDVEVRGCPVRRGDAVHMVLGAANHDPAQFKEPDSFDIDRQNNRHLAFGHGVHLCLGAALARLETAIAVSTFLQRFPMAELTEEAVSWGTHLGYATSLGALQSLPVRLRGEVEWQ